jgi:hypothetical protein
MGLAITAKELTENVASVLLATGLFERVNQYEPKSAPGNGLTAAVWFTSLDPYPGGSGINATTGTYVFTIRLYTSMLSDPQDMIDPNLIDACDTLFDGFSEDYELDSSVRNIDLLGETGNSLSARSKYLDQDGKLFRIIDITLPLIVNDVWVHNA